MRASNPAFEPAQLCVGRVTHHRFAPRAHRFGHRVFFARFALSRIEQAQNRLFGVNRRNVLSLHYADYGPGDGTAPRIWIDALLRREGIDAGGEIVLQTFPRVFGYVFNPVSFWHCHDVSGAVRAIIAEVNNTFGERHCYLIAHPDGQSLRQGQTLRARKVFHVSPFFAVQGHYRFRFHWSASRVLARIEYWDASGAVALNTAKSRVRLALMKASWLYCVASFQRWIVIGARSEALIRGYRRLGFADVFGAGEMKPLAHAGNLPHRVLAFDAAGAERSWHAAQHPLYDFMVRTRHPDLQVFDGLATVPEHADVAAAPIAADRRSRTIPIEA